MNRIFPLFILLCLGCEPDKPQSNRLPTIPVSGSVLLNGKPLSGARIVFHPAEPREGIPRPTAITDPAGSFTLKTYEVGDGAPLGRYCATISCKGPYEGKEEDRDEVAPEIMPYQYLQPHTSGLIVDVEGNDVRLSPWKLNGYR